MSVLNMTSLNFCWMLSEFGCYTFGLMKRELRHMDIVKMFFAFCANLRPVAKPIFFTHGDCILTIVFLG